MEAWTVVIFSALCLSTRVIINPSVTISIEGLVPLTFLALISKVACGAELLIPTCAETLIKNKILTTVILFLFY